MSDLGDVGVQLKKVFENPIVRVMLKHFSQKKRLDPALEIAVGERKPRNIGEWFNYKVIDFAISQGAKAFGGTKDDFIGTFKDPYYRRGLVTTVRSVAEYGITKPQKLVAPFLVVWNITKKCNLRCIHCYANATPQGAPDELSTEEKKQLIDQMDEAGVVAIAFSGGEPLMAPDIFEIFKYTSEKGIYVNVATNGTLITPEVARKMKESGVGYVEVSLDSPDPEEHDKFRGVKGAWKLAVQGIKNAKEAGLCTGIAYTVTKQNLHRVPEMVQLARDLGVCTMIFFNFVPVGRGKEIQALDLGPKEREELMKYLYAELEKGGLNVFSTSPTYARISVEKVMSKQGDHVSLAHFGDIPLDPKYADKAVALADFVGGCGAGRAYCALDHNGDVYPCVFLPIKVGNALKDGFINVWKNSELFNKFRDRDSSEHFASRCPFRYVCGGCRARAYAYTGDPLGPDPGCVISDKLMENTNYEKYKYDLKDDPTPLLEVVKQ